MKNLKVILLLFISIVLLTPIAVEATDIVGEDTGLFTIGGKKIYSVEEWYESELSNILFYDKYGNEVYNFVEFDEYGNQTIKYRIENEAYPTHSVYISNFADKKEIAVDVAGTQVVLPDCPFKLWVSKEQQRNPDDYGFKYWRLSTGGDVKFYQPGDVVTIPDYDIVLEAVFWLKSDFEAHEHTIMFVPNNGINPVSIVYLSGTEISLDGFDELYTTGYMLSYWTDGSNKYYSKDTFIMPDHDVTLTAVWERIVYNNIDWSPLISQLVNDRKTTEEKADTEKKKYNCPYKDISGHWAEEFIIHISELGLIDGITETQFKPNEPMTREMFVVAIARFAGVEGNYIDWAIENEILKGYGNGKYGLEDTVTREQMAVFFERFLEKMNIDITSLKTKEKTVFADDTDISEWAKESVYAMQEIKLIQGKENNVFDPLEKSTRAQAATVLNNLINVLAEQN